MKRIFGRAIRRVYSIGVLTGGSLHSLPAGMDDVGVLTHRDVSDVQASAVADPFMVPVRRTA
jgi:hypothetical protein